MALLDKVSRDAEDDINEVLNDSETEFYVEEETYNSLATNSTQIEHNLLIQGANVHILENTKKEFLKICKILENPSKKSK